MAGPHEHAGMFEQDGTFEHTWLENELVCVRAAATHVVFHIKYWQHGKQHGRARLCHYQIAQ